MTVKLQNGDFCLDERGRILETGGSEELLERALLRLKARRGCFQLDPTLGSDLYKIDLNHAEPQEIEPLIIEALEPLHEVIYEGLEVQANRQNGELTLIVYMRVGEQSAAVELAPRGLSATEKKETIYR